MRPFPPIVASLLGAAALATSAALPVHAQAPGDTLAFERVGDQPISAFDLAFGGGDTLWAAASRLYRLPPGTAAWEEVRDRSTPYVLPLGPDTLLIGHPIRRSTDGGATFVEVYDDGERLFEAPASGALLAGTEVGGGVAYSHDRGATWAEGTVEGGTGTWGPWAEGFAELPPGGAYGGRLVAACWAGLSYSDDGGATWQKSDLWEDGGRYYAFDAAVGADGAVYGAFYEQGVAGLQIAASADGGQTYTAAYRFTTYHGTGVRLLALPAGSDPAVGVLVVVHYDGSVWRSDDGAASWRRVGQVPFTHETSGMWDAALDADGRLYVAGVRPGTTPEWVYRTVEPVVQAAVAVEAEPENGTDEIGADGGAVVFTVTLSNTTGQPLALQAWTAATGPVDRSPLLGPVAFTLPAGATVTRRLVQRVPAVAPAGTYTYTVAVGRYPDGVVSSDSFLVVKGAGGGGASGAGAEGWAVSGWDEASAAAPYKSAPLALAVVPNPTRGAATVALTLSRPSDVRLVVYDVLGREVAAVAAGRLEAGSHRLDLDVRALPAGVYVWRLAAGERVETGRLTVAR